MTGDVVWWWKERFKDLLNLCNTSSGRQAEPQNFVEDLPLSLADVTEVVKKLLGEFGGLVGTDMICVYKGKYLLCSV